MASCHVTADVSKPNSQQQMTALGTPQGPVVGWGYTIVVGSHVCRGRRMSVATVGEEAREDMLCSLAKEKLCRPLDVFYYHGHCIPYL